MSKTKRAKRRGGRRGNQHGFNPKVAVMSAALVASIGGLGFYASTLYGKPVPDKMGCYEALPQSHTLALADVSEPRFNAEQARAIETFLTRAYDELRLNERLSVITTEGDQISSVPKARFAVCGQARSPSELEEAGAGSATAGFLAKQRQRLFEKRFAPEVAAILDAAPDDVRRQTSQSPILESIRGLSRMAEFKHARRLIVISDLLQNSESAKFCAVRGDMPRFSIFARKPVYDRLRPESFDGVSVDVLMVQRPGIGKAPLQYCSGEDELRRFYRDYFKAGGAERVTFTRIRHGGTAG